MSVVTVHAMGMTATVANLVLLGLTVVAVIASFGWGRLVDSWGPKRTLMVVLWSWAIGLVLGGISIGLGGAPGIGLFLIAGAILGSGLGGVQVADRVFMLRLSPPARLGEFFGLYGLVGKGSQVVGQLLYGLILLWTFDALGNGAYQIAVLSLLVTMLIGAWLLRPVSRRLGGIRRARCACDAAAGPTLAGDGVDGAARGVGPRGLPARPLRSSAPASAPAPPGRFGARARARFRQRHRPLLPRHPRPPRPPLPPGPRACPVCVIQSPPGCSARFEPPYWGSAADSARLSTLRETIRRCRTAPNSCPVVLRRLYGAGVDCPALGRGCGAVAGAPSLGRWATTAALARARPAPVPVTSRRRPRPDGTAAIARPNRSSPRGLSGAGASRGPPPRDRWPRRGPADRPLGAARG